MTYKYVSTYYDRHGKLRIYFRRHGKLAPLPGPVGSTQFAKAYEAALAQAQPVQGKPHSYPPKSVGALVAEYRKSARYIAIKKSTKSAYNGPLEWLLKHYGPAPVPEMTLADVIKIQGRKARDGLAAANTVVKILRILVGLSIDLGWRTTDPTLRVKKLKEGEHRAWDEAELASFEARWPIGTPERLGYALALFTGQRRSDVAAMTRMDVNRLNRTVRVVQEKTGTKLMIPLHRDLWATLEAYPRDTIALLASSRGGPYTAESFGNLMADAIRAAGLPEGCKLHGLRKSAGMRLAEVGCTTREIMAVLGHRSLSQAEHYTKHVRQEKLAKTAIIKLERGGDGEQKEAESV